MPSIWSLAYGIFIHFFQVVLNVDQDAAAGTWSAAMRDRRYKLIWGQSSLLYKPVRTTQQTILPISRYSVLPAMLQLNIVDLQMPGEACMQQMYDLVADPYERQDLLSTQKMDKKIMKKECFFCKSDLYISWLNLQCFAGWRAATEVDVWVQTRRDATAGPAGTKQGPGAGHQLAEHFHRLVLISVFGSDIIIISAFFFYPFDGSCKVKRFWFEISCGPEIPGWQALQCCLISRVVCLTQQDNRARQW